MCGCCCCCRAHANLRGKVQELHSIPKHLWDKVGGAATAAAAGVLCPCQRSFHATAVLDGVVVGSGSRVSQSMVSAAEMLWQRVCDSLVMLLHAVLWYVVQVGALDELSKFEPGLVADMMGLGTWRMKGEGGGVKQAQG